MKVEGIKIDLTKPPETSLDCQLYAQKIIDLAYHVGKLYQSLTSWMQMDSTENIAKVWIRLPGHPLLKDIQVLAEKVSKWYKIEGPKHGQQTLDIMETMGWNDGEQTKKLRKIIEGRIEGEDDGQG